ncbi:hypothetical protein LguiB_020929 [Lonicera macranthoides]
MAYLVYVLAYPFCSQFYRHEAEFIMEIIKVIGAKLRRTLLFVAPIVIGMHYRAKTINKWLQDDSSEVSLLGICGMGGIGKTTIAKFVYNENYESFDGSCFLAIREMLGKPDGLAGLQRQLLSCILNKKHEKIYNTHEGVLHLEKLILKGCVSLIEICESIEFLEEVDLLDLTDSKNLRKLPRNLYKLGSLETLIISGCSTLSVGGLDISATSTVNGQEGGDEIDVLFIMGDAFEVKECGINIMYEEEDTGVVSDGNNNTSFHSNEVVGRDLSWLHLSTETYFLSRKLHRCNYPGAHQLVSGIAAT